MVKLGSTKNIVSKMRLMLALFNAFKARLDKFWQHKQLNLILQPI